MNVQRLPDAEPEEPPMDFKVTLTHRERRELGKELDLLSKTYDGSSADVMPLTFNLLLALAYGGN